MIAGRLSFYTDLKTIAVRRKVCSCFLNVKDSSLSIIV